MRLFLAINLPRAERRAIHEATAGMRAAAPRVSWVKEEALHLTLKFFGERAEHAVPPLRNALEEVAARHRTPTLRLGGLGAFPNLRAPRIVWLGVAHEPPLELLFNELEAACAAVGYEVEGRVFRPHVTLGRVKDRVGADMARALAAAARGVRYEGIVPVSTVDLMASQLGPGGPKYTVVGSLPLGGA